MLLLLILFFVIIFLVIFVTMQNCISKRKRNINKMVTDYHKLYYDKETEEDVKKTLEK